MAAGDGIRLGAGKPKAFCEIAGSTLLEHAVSRLASVARVSEVVVVAHPTGVDLAVSLLPATVAVVAGGATRQQSVSAGLFALVDPPDFVLVHDVARAFTPSDVVDRVIGALDNGADAVIPVLPVVDTLTSVDDTGAVLGTVDRSSLRAVQTPQGFRYTALVEAHAAAEGVEHTDDASVVERHGGTVVAVDGSELAFKVTRPLDLALAEVVARS
ncbi:2-C-methyl-D-erythritol 4-phosphate cytidylyltransferase [Jatrophihabitans sp. YIM 134969]